jgi:cation-dependent mannose-6-phosphate receptor
VFLIVFFVVATVYVVGGMIYNRVTAGKTGVEMIPQYEFWASLPGLIGDGFRFAFSCGCFARTGYKPM